MSTTVSQAEFVRLVGEGYEHLYDPVFFRAHPLSGLLVPDPRLAAKERGWRLQRLLLDAIDELDPGPQAPAFSLEMRRYQLMSLHYTDGLDPQTVADRLGISRRHFYRELAVAVEAIAAILWERCQAQPAPASRSASGAGEPADRLELLRLEAARLARAGRYARLHDVLPGVLSLLEERLALHGLATRLNLPDDLPEVAIDHNLLRQMLLAMLSFLVERARQCTLQLAALAMAGELHVTVRVEQPECLEATSAAQAEECRTALADLARLAEAQLRPLQHGAATIGFELRLPLAPQRTILVVDDNADVRELFQRYLAPHGYRVLTAGSAREARELARQAQPDAITLDLMMPDQDGWDLMQHLLNQPSTRHIPILICSVLHARELALSLGATAFLAKPVTEQALLAALEAMERETSSIKRQA